MVKINRRQWLQFAAGLTITNSLTAVKRSLALEVLDTKIELRVWSPDGKPLDKYSLNQLYFLDLNDQPIPPVMQYLEEGRLITLAPKNPFAIALVLAVDGFGKVALYADNNGRGYTPADFPLNLNLAFARTRLHRVRNYLNHNRSKIEFSQSIEARLARAKRSLEKATATNNIVAQVGWCNLSLVESMWAGEIAVFEQAKQEIAQQEPRKDFLFGGNFFGYSPDNFEYNRQFKQLFNFATVPFYWRSFEPKQGEKNYARVEGMVNWLEKNNIVAKGHALVYFHNAGTPDWLKDKPYAEVKQLAYQRSFEITNYYQEKIPYHDIINEANNIPWANTLNYDREQFLELTRIASDAAIAGYPRVKRIINHCCIWGENLAYGNPTKDSSPYQYLKLCLDANIPFEIIGLQVYYPDRDMFEINRLLDRFATLGKPIHITELGTSSATDTDETSILKEPTGLWHKPWTEAIQANWIEQFYTLCYSKPYIEAISWWDLADGGNFWAHGGLLHPDMQPKQSFYRLSRLIKTWQNP